MKKTKRFLTCIGACLLLFVFVSLYTGVAGAEGWTFQEVEFSQTYTAGHTLTLPKSVYKNNSESVTARSVVYYPSGKALKSASVVLDEAGTYRVRYDATIGGRLYENEYTFTVQDGKYSFTSNRSSAHYGTNKNCPQNAAGTVQEGLSISLAKGDTFRYNKVIDLASLGSEEELIRLYATPSSNDSAEAYAFDVKLVDAYNEDNYILIHSYGQQSQAWDTWKPKYIFQTAAVPSAGQVLMGWFYDVSEGYYPVVGSAYYSKLKVGATGEGYSCLMSLYGRSFKPVYNASRTGYTWEPIALGSNEDGYGGMSLYYDNEQKRLYGNKFLDLSTFITDFDDPSIYGDCLWDGFTTGEVYVEITADSYVSNEFNFVITQIGEENLNEKTLTDEKGPIVDVDFGDYTQDSCPNALVDHPYGIFPALATDDGKRVNVSCRVFQNYGTDARYEVSSYGGVFVPEETGIYTLEYRAVDWYGNETIRTVNITAEATAPPITFSVDIQSAAKTGVAGSTIEVAAASYGGGSGELTYVAQASLGDEVYDLSEGSFRPLSAGVYTVTYLVTDYVGQSESASYQIEVVDETRPVFLTDAQFPKYFIDGGTYDIPQITASDLHSLAVYTARVEVTDGNGTRTLLGKKYSPVAGADGYATVTYYADNDAGESSVSYRIPIVNVLSANGKYLFRKYFYGENVTFTAARDRITASFEQDVSFDFIKEVLANSFSFQFGMDHENAQNDFERFELVLTDSEDSRKQVVITVVKGTTYALHVNGKSVGILSGFTENGSTATLTYDESIKTLKGGSVDYIIKTYENGEQFEGFPSCKLNLSVRFIGVTGQTAFVMKRINNATLTSGESDNFAPQINVGGYSSTATFGKTFKTPVVTTADVFDTNLSGNMSVTDEKGNPLKDVSGKLLDGVAIGEYEVLADVYGTVTVSYRVSDSTRTAYATVYINIPDTVPPVITTTSTPVSSAKVGQTINVPSASAQDAISGSCEVVAAIVDPDRIITMCSGNSFVATKRGVYIIKYFAYDESGNMMIVSYTVTVE